MRLEETEPVSSVFAKKKPVISQFLFVSINYFLFRVTLKFLGSFLFLLICNFIFVITRNQMGKQSTSNGNGRNGDPELPVRGNVFHRALKALARFLTCSNGRG